MTEEILAFSAHQVSRLASLSLSQLSYWDRTSFFSPEYASGYRRSPFSRVYSFRDLVGLYTLALFRKRYRLGRHPKPAIGRHLKTGHRE